MMWSRKELKTNAKGSLKRNYWKAVLVGIILCFVSYGGAASTGNSARQNVKTVDMTSYLDQIRSIGSSALGITTFFTGAVIMTVIIAIVIKLILWNNLEVGCLKFFTQCGEKGSGDLGDVFYGFKNKYGHIAFVMFLRSLCTMLWTCLLFVPGIVKGYEYMMIPYILAEDPTISRADAFAKSKEMMNGNKWNAFVLDLSFIGWSLLGTVTCGLVQIFFVTPYIGMTKAELYRTLRDAK